MLVCDVCQQAWEAHEGDRCILCDRLGKPARNADWSHVHGDLTLPPVRKRRPRTATVRLDIKPTQFYPMLLILHEEIARVTSIPEQQRSKNDQAILATANDLLHRLTKRRKTRTQPKGGTTQSCR